MKFTDLDTDRQEAILILNAMLNSAIAALSSVTNVSENFWQRQFNQMAANVVDSMPLEEINDMLSKFDKQIESQIEGDENEE